MPALTRGPLPASVYWRRRLIVLTVVLVLLWAMIHLLGGGNSGTPKATPAADLTGASTSASPSAAASESAEPSDSASASASQAPSASPSAVTETPSPTVLPTPTGACPPSDLSVTPSVTGAAAGSPVSIVLNLATFTTPACTWHLSHKTMQVKVSTASGADVWSTIDCPAALPTSDVVVYKDQPTPVTLTWSARRSDSTCSTHTAWSKQGTYSVTGVALGGTPDQTSFTLGPPVPVTPTPTAPTAPASSAPAAPATTPSTQPTSPATSAPATPKKKHHKKHPIVD